MELLTYCPICNNIEFLNFLKTKDYFYSKKEFTIQECLSCGFRFTNPRPGEFELNSYYDSENYLSHSSQKTGLLPYFYNLIKIFSIKKKFALINNLTSGKSILDIGSGSGEFLNYFNKNNWQTLGIEPNEYARDYAKSTYSLDIQDESFLSNINDNSFDVISMWHVLEHVPKLNERIIQVKRILKNNGTIIIAIPISNSFDAKHYNKYWAAYDVPRHLYHFSQSSFKKLMEKHNLSIENIIPLIFDSFYISLISEKYKTGSSKILSSLLIGLRSNFSAYFGNKNYSSLIFVINK
ncbi:MAG: class I SAM-dependent methyltransferase [Bacteroidales bacterium]|nr:class I SAM-dependent methyltransferase [Bacteroidales bacterium]